MIARMPIHDPLKFRTRNKLDDLRKNSRLAHGSGFLFGMELFLVERFYPWKSGLFQLLTAESTGQQWGGTVDAVIFGIGRTASPRVRDQVVDIEAVG